jgi:hypothetical protein
MMYQIACRARRKTPDQKIAVAYFIDESNYSGRIQEAHRAIQVNHPTIGKSLAAPPTPMNDKKTPALQASDLIANIVKDGFLNWISKGKPRGGVQLETKWVRHFDEPIGIWDTQHILRTLKKTRTSKRFIRGELARHPRPNISRRERKRRQRVLIQKRTLKGG